MTANVNGNVMSDENLQVMKAETGALAPVERPTVTAMQLLQGAIQNGITKETVEVVKELRQMVREERDDNAKIAFNKAFFQMRKAAREIYADREVKDNSGNVAFAYCTPEEIDKVVEPMLLAHGFTTLVGQEMDDSGRVTVSMTILHEEGHSETRSFTVKTLSANRMMEGAKCDAGATTLALRHLKIKMLGLKVRGKLPGDLDDPRNLGQYITQQQADELEHRLKMVNGNIQKFLELAEATSFKTIYASKLPVLESQLRRKESRPQ